MLNAEQSQKANDIGKTFKAMSKVMDNNEGNLKRCCICVIKGSNTAVATDGHILTAVNISEFIQAADKDIVTAFELVAFYADLKMVEYTNAFVFIGKKLYEPFIKMFSDGLASINTSDFEYSNRTRILPDWSDLTREIEATYDPKFVCIVNNVIDAYFEGCQEHFEDVVVEDSNHKMGIAIYDKMTVLLLAKNHGEDYQKTPISRTTFEEVKKLGTYYHSEAV